MALWIKPDGTMEEVQPKAGVAFTLQELQGFVGGYIEMVRLDAPTRRMFMIVNEEGRLIGLTHNLRASLLAEQAIFGDVLLATFKELEGREEWEPEEVEEA